MKGCEIVLSNPIGSGMFLVSRSSDGRWYEKMPRYLTHHVQHPLIERGLPDLLARQVSVDGNHVDHMSPEYREMSFPKSLHCRSLIPSPRASSIPRSCVTLR